MMAGAKAMDASEFKADRKRPAHLRRMASGHDLRTRFVDGAWVQTSARWDKTATQGRRYYHGTECSPSGDTYEAAFDRTYKRAKALEQAGINLGLGNCREGAGFSHSLGINNRSAKVGTSALHSVREGRMRPDQRTSHED